MHGLYCALLLVAVILFAASALGATTRRVNLLSAGLFFFSLVFFIQEARKVFG